MAATSTIPLTPTLPGWTPTHPRPLGHIGSHPDLDATATPALPTEHRPSVFHATTHGVYRLSTHLVPSAYPRLASDTPLPEIPPYVPGESSSERRSKAEQLVKHAFDAQDAYVAGEGEPSKTLSWNVVNRYVRAPGPNGTGLTLFLAHANGFHKETWEPMLRGLLDSPAGKMIDEVWAWDAANHGDAAVLNAKHQSGICDWLDNSRDMANFLLHYLPEEVDAGVLPTRLARVSASATGGRVQDGYRTRKLAVVGHSFGGCTSVRVAIDFPRLFSSFVLVDPVIHRPGSHRPGNTEELIRGAFTRRDRWSSRDEALQGFKKSPFFSAWHPAVLQLYVDHALIDDPKGGVRLKMSGLIEGLSFASRATSSETWELLEHLDEKIALRWIVPDQPLSSKQRTYERVWRRPANATNIVFHFCGHLIVQEAPCELARDISEFLLRKYGSVKSHL